MKQKRTRPLCLGGFITLVVAFTDVAQVKETREETRERLRHERSELIWAHEGRIRATEPRRRDGPLRYLNIRDSEVLEIRAVSKEVFAGEMVYISSVVTGCACEDGPKCTDQVWVYTNNKRELFDGILLSKIDKKWTIGPVQYWWLLRAWLTENRKRFKSDRDYWEAEDKLTLRFPACLDKIAKAISRKKEK